MDLAAALPWLLTTAAFGVGAGVGVRVARRRQRQVGGVGEAVIKLSTPVSLRQPLPAIQDQLLQVAEVASCDAAFAAIHGFPDSERLVGRTLGDLFAADDLHNRLALQLTICHGGSASDLVTRGVRRDGEVFLAIDDWSADLRDGAVHGLRVRRRSGAAGDVDTILRRRELRLRKALVAARTGLWRWRIARDDVAWSVGTFDVFGVTPGTFGGTLQAFRERVHPDDRDGVQRRIDEVLDGGDGVYHDEYRVVGDDGEVRWIEARGCLEREDGELCMTGTVTEVTARKLAETALRDSEKRFASLTDGAFESVAITVDGRLVDVNQRFVDTFGYSRERLLGQPATIIVHPDDRAQVAANIRARVTERYEHRAVCADGSHKLVEVQGREIPVGDVIGRVTSLRDLTAQRKHEAQLVRIAEGISAKTGEAFFRSLVENLGLVLGADHALVAEVSRERHGFVHMLAVYGDGPPPPSAYIEIVGTPLERILQQEVFAIAGGAAAEFPVGGWVRSLGIESCFAIVLRDAGGAPSGLVAVMFDESMSDAAVVISALRIFAVRVGAELARRSHEAELMESEARLRATIENTPNVAVQWYDDEGRVLFWNKASEQVFGWAASDAIGRTLDQLIYGDQEARAFVTCLRHIAETGAAIGPRESAFRRRDGTAGVCLSTIFAIPGGGARRTFVCMDVDVTAQKVADKRREELAHHLIVAQEAERRRLAGELHDSLGQSLSMIKNRAHLARAQLGGNPLPELDAIERLVVDSLAEVRSLVHNLRPMHVEAAGLTTSLRELVEEVAAATTIRFACQLEPVDDVVAGDEAVHVYRIAQEALHNVVKHSRAAHARVRLERDLRSVRLCIDDDGVGFAPDVDRGVGLDSMAERATLIGATLTVDGRPSQGTSLRLELPVPEPANGGMGEPGSGT